MGKVIINPLNFALDLHSPTMLFDHFALDATKFKFLPFRFNQFLPAHTFFFFVVHPYRRRAEKMFETKREEKRGGSVISRCLFDGCDRDATPPSPAERGR